MLSDEEKKDLLKKLEYCEQEYEQNGYLSVGKFKAIKQAIELIEKQQKEIEELKNGQIDFWISDKEIEERIRNKFVNKDKIKAKIEEYKKQQKEEPDAYLCKRVLQSLLEK